MKNLYKIAVFAVVIVILCALFVAFSENNNSDSDELTTLQVVIVGDSIDVYEVDASKYEDIDFDMLISNVLELDYVCDSGFMQSLGNLESDENNIIAIYTSYEEDQSDSDNTADTVNYSGKVLKIIGVSPLDIHILNGETIYITCISF